LTKEGNIHVDAPTSSGTRNNKDGCVGKIVLDRRVVKRDVKDGVVGYCEGVSGTVSAMILERMWLMNRVIGRGLSGSSGERDRVEETRKYIWQIPRAQGAVSPRTT
jgi:hypothetical protein